ncbi:MAG: sporulation protein YqfD [Bacilli bacterium]
MKSYIYLSITGKDIYRYIKNLLKRGINFESITYVNKTNCIIKVTNLDYKKILEVKTIYKLNIVKYEGINNIYYLILKYKYALISFFVGFIFLFLLSNTIWEINVIHSNNKTKEYVLEELKKHGIEKLKLMKNFNSIEKIEEKILKENKDTIEWIEITRNGTTYEVKLVDRKINKKENETKPQDIIARKNSIIKSIRAENGDIIKEVNEYVKKGETIITGLITANEEVKFVIAAKGKVYGEVWYVAKVKFPLVSKEILYTGKSKTVYNIRFLNTRLNFFNFNEYEDSKRDTKIIYDHLKLPFSFNKDTVFEVKQINNEYNYEQGIYEAIKLATSKIEERLNEGEYIINKKVLKKRQNNSIIDIEIFFKVCENITDYKKIEKIDEEIKEK